VFFGGEKFVLEMKIKNRNYTQKKSCIQLSQYLDSIGMNSGYLLTFETAPSTEIPWEQRIKWQETEYELQGINRKITIVEM